VPRGIHDIVSELQRVITSRPREPREDDGRAAARSDREGPRPRNKADEQETSEMINMEAVAVPKFENGLKFEARQELAEQLGDVLDAVYSLMIRTHVYHWNVEGPLFEPVHKLTEAQYTALFQAVDEIAERMRALDAKPAVNANSFPTGVSNIPASLSAEKMIAELVRQHEGVVRRMRDVVALAEKVDDVVTADLLTGLMARHEKDAWMLRSTLQH
jgi:starvation-inducible DNA-binding protein